MKNILLRFALLTYALPLLFALGLSGCGGGSSSSSGPLYPLASTTRTLQTGYTYTYKTTGQEYDPTGQRAVNTQYTVTIGTTTYNGSTVLTRRDASPGGLFFLRQNADSSLTYVGGGSGFCNTSPTCSLDTPQPALFGQWHVGDKFIYALRREGGASYAPIVAATWQIVGTEEVDIPLGRFMTWKVQVTYDTNAAFLNGGYSETYWYAPQLGTYVKRTDNGAFTVPPENGETTTSILTATNVPLN